MDQARQTNDATPSSLFHGAVYLTGATASGKSAIGVELAALIGAEVIALDSMTLYRGMDIGTAKPTLEERGGVPHHLIDVIDPWLAASVADFRTWAGDVLIDLAQRGKRALFVGGTPLYLKACLRGLFEGPGADMELRGALEQQVEQEGGAAVLERLRAVDPVTAARLHANDSRRIIRALEVIELTGRPLSSLQTEHDQPAPPGVKVFAIERPRPLLHDRINRRVESMFRQGLVEEVRRLQSGPHPLHEVPAQGVGYLEVAALLKGELGLAEAVERTKARTRQFSKRQATWFRGLSEVRSWPVEAEESPRTTADRLRAAIESA